MQRFGVRADAVLRRVRVLMRMLCYGVLAVPCRAVRVHALYTSAKRNFEYSPMCKTAQAQSYAHWLLPRAVQAQHGLNQT